MSRRARRVVAGVVGVVVAGTVTAGAAALSPLVSDWDRYFRVEAQATPRDGRTVVNGTVWNTAPWGAKRIQLLVEGLDATGTVLSQRVVWLGTDLTAGSHGYFEVPVSGTAARYRVSVFAFDSGRRR